MGKLADLLQHDLDPRVLTEKTETLHDDARAKATLESSIVRSHGEFESLNMAYVAHHTKETFGMAFPPEHCLDKARRFIDQSIGYDNAAFIALSGTEGGMPYVLNQINEGFKKEAKQAYFNHVLTVIDPLNFQEIVELMVELKEKLGAYSPESFNYISPEQMAANYKDILFNYINSLTRYRNLWAY